MTTKLDTYMDYLYNLEDRRSYGDLKAFERLKLAGLIMQDMPNQEQAEFFIETMDFNDIFLDLANLMVNACSSELESVQEDRLAFTHKIMASMACRAKNAINSLFETYQGGDSHEEPND